MSHIFSALEEIVQRDEGKRGISSIILPGELEVGARDLLNASRVTIITGFPCLLDLTPPTETDGPLGAMAIARALVNLGKEVVVCTDECNADCMLACAAGAGIAGAKLRFESFAPIPEWDEGEESRLQELADWSDFVVAIERAGPARAGDGAYLTMRARNMSAIVAPLERLLTMSSRPMRSFGIGDGGNEVGMGKLMDRLLVSGIPNIEQIACTAATTHLLTASVSNWGGYALAVALAVAASENAAVAEGRDLATLVAQCVPSNDDEMAMCQRLVAAGARCGVTRSADPMVDGMPMSESLRVLDELRAAALSA